MITEILISELKNVTHENINHVRQKFSSLTPYQRNWKAEGHVWSINEVFAHLNEFSNHYHTTFKLKIDHTRHKEPKDTFISSPLGRSAWKSMKLGNVKNIKRKFKAQKSFNPVYHKELVTQNDIEQFELKQHELLSIIDSATKVNMRKIKIPVSISKIIRLRLGDALLYLVYHNERHVYQALSLLNHPLFPSK